MLQDLTALQVRNTNTGELYEFTFTRAGIYKLAKYLAVRGNQAIRTVIDNLGNHEIFRELMGDSDWYRVRIDLRSYFNIRNDDYFPYFSISFLAENAVKSALGRWAWKKDCFKLSNTYSQTWYPRKWKKYVRRCDECENLFFDQALIEEDNKENIIHRIDSKDLGYDGYCNDCLPDNYRQCEDCGRIINIDCDDYAYVNDNLICDDCLRNSGNYYCCDYCGEWFYADDGYFPDDGGCYCSSDCCENDGYHWSERYDTWVRGDDYDNEIDEIIPDYHSHCVDINFVGKMSKRQKHWLGGGTETELDGQSRYDYSYDYFENLWNMFGGADYCYFEQDGSVEFEIISQPMTEQAFFAYDWEKPFNKLINDGWRSHDTTTCGRHFHYSKWYLGYTDNQRHNNAKKICRFFQIFADDIKKIARRDFNHYAADLRNFHRGEAISPETSYDMLSNDRYWAVNLTNLDRMGERRGTIEIRICKGTLKASTTRASFDIFLHIVRNAKNISWKNINNLKLWLKGIKRKETIDYIKARHAFSEVF